MSNLNSITFGIEVAQEFVAAYGPVATTEIDRELRVQTNLNERNRQQVIQAGIATDWELYDGMDNVYWNRDNEDTAGIEFDFLVGR